MKPTNHITTVLLLLQAKLRRKLIWFDYLRISFFLSLAMAGRHVLLFILLSGMLNTEIFAVRKSSTSSRSAYFVTKENKRLKGHVVKRFESPSLLSCSHACMKTEWCTSTTFKLSSKKHDKGTCALNKHISLVNEYTFFHEQEDVAFSVLFKVTKSITYIKLT